MSNKILLLSLACAGLLSSCSFEKENTRMHERVASKEHDELLFGWWKLVNDDTYCIYYDDVEFKQIYAIVNEDGEYEVTSPKYRYWYTENNVLFTLRDATSLTGIIEASVGYQFSEDKNTVLEPDGNGGWLPALYRVLK